MPLQIIRVRFQPQFLFSLSGRSGSSSSFEVALHLSKHHGKLQLHAPNFVLESGNLYATSQCIQHQDANYIINTIIQSQNAAVVDMTPLIASTTTTCENAPLSPLSDASSPLPPVPPALPRLMAELGRDMADIGLAEPVGNVTQRKHPNKNTTAASRCRL